EKLNANPVAIQLPIGSESDFTGVVDLIQMKALIWQGDGLGEKYDVTDIPAAMMEQAQAAREQLVERAAEADEELTDLLLMGEAISEERIKSALRKGSIARKLTVVLCGSAFKNKGVQPLLDAVIDFLPSPLDIPSIHGKSPKDESHIIEC